MGRRRRVLGVALLVTFAWLGGCAPLVPARNGVQLSVAAPAEQPGARSRPATVPQSEGVGGSSGLQAHTGTNVWVRLPSGRRYVLHVPAANDGAPRPLLIALHGMALAWESIAWSGSWSEYADQHGFVVAYGVGFERSWNLSDGCCGAAARRRVNDVDYLVRVVNDVASRIAVDRSRVYVTGFSNGDSMAVYAQCARPDVFAASAGTGGALLAPCVTANEVRVLHLHGVLDRTVPYRGGYSAILHRRVVAVRDFAGQLKGEAPAATVTVQTLPCGHEWPTLRNTCHVDGTDLIWRWLSQFSR